MKKQQAKRLELSKETMPIPVQSTRSSIRILGGSAMFKRLFVLMLLALATLSVSTSARASTPIGVSLSCYQVGVQPPWYATYHCVAGVSGGTGSYVYNWKINSSHGNYTLVTSEPEIDYTCGRDSQFRIDLIVTDSAGATGSVMGDYYSCNVGDIEPI